MNQSTNIEWLRTENESLKVDLLEGTLGAEPYIVGQFEDYFDGVEELIVSHESQAAEITQLKEQLELYRIEAGRVYDAGYKGANGDSPECPRLRAIRAAVDEFVNSDKRTTPVVYDNPENESTHFQFINPPEEA